MFGMGIGELVVVLVIVFGPGRLPEMMGNLGKAMREFQKGLREPPEIEKAPESDDPSKTSREAKLSVSSRAAQGRRARDCAGITR